MLPRISRIAAFIPALLLFSAPAYAHVKWFAPYVVGAAPRPVTDTLTNSYFWMGVGLVLAFFMTTVLVERSRAGDVVRNRLDQFTGPLWNRADDFTRAIIGAFFIAIFAVGGVYLTPDLKTPSEWVSWIQLLIAIGVFSKRTMKLSAIGIILLWVIALRDYEIFHLLDYLALGLGVAAYLWLASSEDKPEWYEKRFFVLRWGVAIALMWSSLEKFAYPEWFYPLVDEKPFLTFGLPRDMFIPMAGVAEFTMGFGLLWTPLIRRLSAIALLIIFNAAVYPFGRIDLVGHALIMCTLILILIDPTRMTTPERSTPRALALVPTMLLVAMLSIGGAYWGLHRAFFGAEGDPAANAEMLTHTPNAEHPHGRVIETVPDRHLH